MIVENDEGMNDGIFFGEERKSAIEWMSALIRIHHAILLKKILRTKKIDGSSGTQKV